MIREALSEGGGIVRECVEDSEGVFGCGAGCLVLCPCKWETGVQKKQDEKAATDAVHFI